MSECGGDFAIAGEGIDKIDKGATDGCTMVVLPFGANPGGAGMLVEVRERFPKCGADFFLCFHWFQWFELMNESLEDDEDCDVASSQQRADNKGEKKRFHGWIV